MAKWYKELDKKFAWSFFGFLIGILGFGFGLFTYLHKEKPQIQFEVLTNTDVINVKENIGNLQILYKNENVLSFDTTLKIVTIKLINSGNVSIKKDFYDLDYPIGLKIQNCQIVDKPIAIEYSSSYLKDRFNFSYDSTNVRINPIILDKGDFVTIKLLLIGAKGQQVKITAIGKIAEQTIIPIITDFEKKDKPSFFNRLLSGSFGLHLARFFFYTFGIGIGLVLILLPIFLISENLTEKSNIKKIKRYKAINDIATDKHYEIIFNLFLDYGVSNLNKIIELASDNKKLTNFLNVDSYSKNMTLDDLKHLGFPIESKSEENREIKRETFIDELVSEKDIIIKNDIEARFNEEFIMKINRFLNYLKI